MKQAFSKKGRPVKRMYASPTHELARPVNADAVKKYSIKNKSSISRKPEKAA